MTCFTKKTDRDKAELETRIEQAKTELYTKTEKDKTELETKIEQTKTALIEKMSKDKRG